MRQISFTAVFVALLCLCASAASAVVLDWNTATWTPSGSVSNSFDIDPANPGNDVTITITGDTNTLTPDPTSGTMTPTVNNSIEGGFGPSQRSLLFHMTPATPQDAITITITFSPGYTMGVGNVSFTLASLDKNSFHDKVDNISGLAVDGVTVLAPTITDVGPAVKLTGNGVNQTLTGSALVPDTGAGSGDGNATINFTDLGIQSVSFRFANGASFPSPQTFAMFNLTFTPVPEINSGAGAAGACVAVAVLQKVRRRRLRRV
ncbi:MAG: hypothetical protein ACJ8KU_06260 [Chthoniobacterales bacterium]